MSPSACGAGGAARLAVQAYLEGERLCDAGRVAEGIRLLRRAIDSEPALDNEEWPSWALQLREGLERAAVRAPLYASPDIDMDGAEAIGSDQIAHLAKMFRERHFAIVDGVISPDACRLAHTEIAREDAAGRLELSTVYASPSTNTVSVALPERRSDRISYLDGGMSCGDAADGERSLTAVREGVDRVDEIVRCLREHVPELSNVATRQAPMLSAYGEGARFERHCDTHCDHDDDAYEPSDGFCANRRRLSAVLYCVHEGWSAACGGALRIYRPTAETGGWDGDDALLDVLPRPGRLVLFASDQRVPHEVRPVLARGATRYALALWYLAPRADNGQVEQFAKNHTQDEWAALADIDDTEDDRQNKDGDERRPLGERESATSVIAALPEL